MGNISRPQGRFFCVLISIVAACLMQRGVAVGEAGLRPPVASSSFNAARGLLAGVRGQSSSATVRLASSSLGSVAGSPFLSQAGRLPNIAAWFAITSPALTQINDIVYRADGTAAQGTVLISWPSFTTAAGQAVAAGTLSVALGANGSFNASLAPNSGASPTGTYYRVIIKLDDGTSDTESWVVPATQTTTIAAIRAKLVPANVAAQFLTRDVADTVYVNVSSNQAVSGVKTFASSPSVPAPQNANDAANKAYVDAQVANVSVSTSGVQFNPTASQSITQPAGTTFAVNFGAIEKLNNVRYADQFAGADAGTKINAAIADLPATGGTVDARGFQGAQNFAVAVTVNKPVSLLLGAANITNVAFKVSADFSLHSNNRATATLTTAAGGTMFTLSGTVHQFVVEGVTLSGSGSGSQLYVSPDYQSGVNDFSMGRFVFDNDIVQYFGAHGVPAITLGRSNYLVSLTRDLFVQNYGCAFVADGSELYVSDSNFWFQKDGPCLNIAGRVRLDTSDFESNAAGTTQPDILVNATDPTQSGELMMERTIFGGESDNNRSKLRVQSANNSPAQRISVSHSHFDGNYPTVAAIDIETPVMNCNFDANYFETYSLLVQDNAPLQSVDAGRCTWGSYQYWNYDTAGFIKPVTLFANGGKSFTKIDADGRQADQRLFDAPIRLEADYMINRLLGSENISGWPQMHTLTVTGGQADPDGGTNAWLVSAPGASAYEAIVAGVDGAVLPMKAGVTLSFRAAAGSCNMISAGLYDATASQFAGGPYAFQLPATAGRFGDYLINYRGLNTTHSYSVFFYPSRGAQQACSFYLYHPKLTDYEQQPYMPSTATAGGYSATIGARVAKGIAAASFVSNSANAAATGMVRLANNDQLCWRKADHSGDQCLSANGNSQFQTSNDLLIGGAVAANSGSVAGDLSVRDIPGFVYFVSKYPSIQAAINAAYNNGTLQGVATVIDDRMAPYGGPGFIVYDSVTLKLAATTYTISGTQTYNNGNNTVTAGIIVLPGSHIVGAGTSANHGTNLNAASGLNADLIATSTVGTGPGANAQWWHWGSIENMHIDGNLANQTAGNCINVENMGETAVLRALEVGNCYNDDIKLEGAFATQSEISNVTVNSAGKFGVDLDNFSGNGVLRGLSGDSNATSIIRYNGTQSATLTVVGLKTEEEVSGQDPLITVDLPTDGSQPGLYIIGGYTYGRSGVNDLIKLINGKAGAAPFINLNNLYVQNYANGVNDTVNGRTVPAANVNKVPFSYMPTGSYLSGQAFTLDVNTFVQAAHSGNYVLTQVFGNTSSNETQIAAAGSSTSVSTGGIGFRMPNRAQYGAVPELMAKMTFAFPGGVTNNQQWEFIPAKVNGDVSTRWIGDPSYRWDEMYSSDVNTTTATVGTLNVTNCNGCGSSSSSGGTHLLNYQTNTATLTGNSNDQTIYSYAIPGGSLNGGTGAHCYLKAQRTAGTGAITYKWKFGATTAAYSAVTSSGTNITSEMEVFDNPGSTTAQIINLGELHTGTTLLAGASYNIVAGENTANAVTVSVSFNAASSEQIKGVTFKCMAEQ